MCIYNLKPCVRQHKHKNQKRPKNKLQLKLRFMCDVRLLVYYVGCCSISPKFDVAAMFWQLQCERGGCMVVVAVPFWVVVVGFGFG